MHQCALWGANGHVAEASRHAMTAVDLFAGAGGFSEGLRQAGFAVLAAVDNDPTAAETYRLNHPEAEVLVADIVDLAPGDLPASPEGRLDLLAASPPCQGFSSLRGMVEWSGEDRRNNLIGEVVRLAAALRPRAVLIENVPGMAASLQWEAAAASFARGGWSIVVWRVDAQHFGVPQRRKRVFALAVDAADGRAGFISSSLADLLPISCCAAGMDAVEALAAVLPADPLHRGRALSPINRARLSALPPGAPGCDLPEHLLSDSHRRLVASGRRANPGPYGRIQTSGPAPTMTTRCTTLSCGRFGHPTELRGITLREAALLQGFPADYEFAGSYGAIEQQIGNAVPPPLGKAAGMGAAAII